MFLPHLLAEESSGDASMSGAWNWFRQLLRIVAVT
jgi:hypothetical protein